VWFGVCDRKSNKVKNCLYEGLPKILGNSDVEKLKQWCPELVAADGDTLTCCDSVQVENLTLCI
jgi:Niemann-Pick C1 N terminus